MPIRRHHHWLYPIDWHELQASIRFRRAKGRCETCGRPHRRLVLPNSTTADLLKARRCRNRQRVFSEEPGRLPPVPSS